MSKVFISRADGSISWGFRLQGGLEYNEPLTATNVSSRIFKRERERERRSLILMGVCRCISINQRGQENNLEAVDETGKDGIWKSF